MYFRTIVLLIKLLLFCTSDRVISCRAMFRFRHGPDRQKHHKHDHPHHRHGNKGCLLPLERSLLQLEDEYYARFHSTRAPPNSERPVPSVLCGTRAYDAESHNDSFDGKAIIHGKDAPEKMWPWQVLIRGEGTCGGVLISDQWVLTAAHCVNNIRYVIAGRTNIRRWTRHAVGRKTAVEIVHRYYNAWNFANDIALIKLDKPVKLNDYVRPICLPDSNTDFGDGENCWVTGWGRSDRHPQSMEPKLQMLKTKIMKNLACQVRNILSFQPILSSQICLDLNRKRPGSGVCMGDSGGPLSCRVDGVFYLAGLASFVEGGCRKLIGPDVYTRVSSYIGWIDENVYRYH